MLTETLRVFCDVVETGSFTATARRHGVTQSAVTQIFHGLEQRFKSRFAVRRPKGFRLTPEGEAFSHATVWDFGQIDWFTELSTLPYVG
jgi:DNA-binding transcriptional LysR family regulator